MIWYVLGGLAAIVLCLIVLAIVSPRKFMRVVMRPMLAMAYRKRVVGVENLPAEGGCLLVSNHVSFIDGILILWMLPRNVRFVVDGGNFKGKILEWIAAAFDTIMMTASPKSIGRAIKGAREGLNNGDVIGVFAEGTITRNSQLQGFRPGLTKMIKGTDAPIVPVWLDGMWGSIFSFSEGKFFFKWPKKFRRKLTLYVGKPMPTDTPVDLVRSQVQDLGSQADIERRADLPNLASDVIRSWRENKSRLQVADSSGVEVRGREALIRALVLRRVLRREVLTGEDKFVGLLLPPSVGGVLANIALAFDRRVAANLNYTVSSEVINHCIADVGIKKVLTSEKFMSKVDLKVDAELVMLESIPSKVTKWDKLVSFVQAVCFPQWLLKRVLGLHRIDPDDILTVIFTSGSTGMPKGVLLSNANVSHNVEAIRRAVKLDHHDTILGVLPFFHSFGYSITLWGAQTLGPSGVYHFNPLDSRQVGKMAERYGVTVLLGTPTFLRGYLKRVEPKQFEKLDVVIVGAEKMPAELFDSFEKKFGVRPVEGYGATELSPLVSVNVPPSRSPARYQPDRVEGSVGRPMPGVSARVISPDTGEELPAGEDGMLLITGPNVMKGYANQAEKTAEAIHDGWYTTGDIAHVDDMGFLHITGRLSRFSKIGGEMVPHVRIEEALAGAMAEGEDDEEVRVCVTAVPCDKKGERIVVLHKETGKSIDALREHLKAEGLPNLFIPAADAFHVVPEIPMLGTGKLDLKAAKELAAKLESD
ncbi:AMP-binding protein [Stieleria varia]|uniref:Bifunctional protein Aas n=1 Tax=Stieleria varia TaxID=2528005 RepID=A0A5C6AUP2_9BACT|nr:AMP-binding protein [Stieleria varia]TWU02776.1 Bifunctional protein Aas [Stieleria varia]